MSTVKALAEVLGAVLLRDLHRKGFGIGGVTNEATIDTTDRVAEDYERLQDIIAVESAGERLATNEAGRAAERAQQAPMTATRAQVLTEAEQVARSVGQLREEHQQEINKLFEAQKRRELHLQLESDRRARNVAERMLALCKVELSRLPRNDERELSMALDGINIEALVDESKI